MKEIKIKGIKIAGNYKDKPYSGARLVTAVFDDNPVEKDVPAYIKMYKVKANLADTVLGTSDGTEITTRQDKFGQLTFFAVK